MTFCLFYFFPCKFLISVSIWECSLNDTTALKNSILFLQSILNIPLLEPFAPLLHMWKWWPHLSNLQHQKLANDLSYSTVSCSVSKAFLIAPVALPFVIFQLKDCSGFTVWILESPFCHTLIYLHLLCWMAAAVEIKRKDTVTMDSFEAEDQQHKVSWKVAFESRRKWNRLCHWHFQGMISAEKWATGQPLRDPLGMSN